MGLLDCCRQYPGWGMDGAELHHPETGVPADRWCVTRRDLKFLRRKVEVAIRKGVILPTMRDPFNIYDELIGPNMYTVVDAYLKPLTRDAGNMSWALLRRPKGIKCGVFITHGWAEGVFELIDKLLCSWPRFTSGAWCCVLANPQNLDIGSLISDPLSSSFAVALRSSSKVMVVPNKKTSIFSRIWCVYEAYLAVEQNCIVSTATPPLSNALRRSVLNGVVLAVLGLVAGAGVASFPCSSHADDLPVPFFSVAVGLAVIPQVCALPRVNLVANAVGIFISCMAWGVAILGFGRDWFCDAKVVALYGGYLVAYFVANEYDRLALSRDLTDAARLHCGYAGAVEAQASVQADKDRIMAQIGDKLSRVDDSINVLISAGRSTPRLRRLASKGYFFRRTQDFCFTLAVTVLRFWVVACIRLHASTGVPERLLLGAGVLASCLLVWFICRADMDEKAFAMAVMGMFQFLDFVWLFFLAIVSRGCLHGLWLWNAIVSCSVTWLATLLAIVGRRRLAKVPYVDRLLARLRV